MASSQYNPEETARHFDEFGMREWDRLTTRPEEVVSLYLHTYYLQKHLQLGWRVLEIGAGAGRFTQVLAGLGVQIVVADLSPVQITLNKQMATQYGYTHTIEAWQVMDICDMSLYPSASFDCVVAYGGPLSYVLDRRDIALGECLRVLKPGGVFLLSVMTLFGTIRSRLQGVLAVPPEVNQKIITKGDLTPATLPGRPGNSMHLFRVEELRTWLEQSALEIMDLSASGFLAVGMGDMLTSIQNDQAAWQELLHLELVASASPGALEGGTHMIVVAQKPHELA